MNDLTNKQIEALDTQTRHMGDMHLGEKLQHLIEEVNEISDMKEYGLVGDGTTNDATKFNELLTSIGSTPTDLYFRPGTYKLASNVTVPTNVNLHMANGAILKRTSSVVITLNCEINAGLYQIFDDDGTGSWAGGQKVITVYPEWFGAKGDGTTNDTVAIKKSSDFLKEGSTLYFTSSKIYVFTEVNFATNKTVITGGGTLKGIVRIGYANDATFDGLTWENTHLDLKLCNLKFKNTSHTDQTNKNIVLRNARAVQIQNCSFFDAYYGIFMETRNKAMPQHVAKVIIDGNMFERHSYNIYGEPGSDLTLDGVWEYGDLHVENNKFRSVRISAFYSDRQDGLVFNGNTIYSYQTEAAKKEGIFCRCLTWGIITSNNIFETGLDGIKIQHTNVVNISNNNIAWPGDNGSGAGIRIQGADPFNGDINNVVISGNIIDNSSDHGVILEQVSGTGAYPIGVSVCNNVFSRIGRLSGSPTYNVDYRMVKDTGCFKVVVSNNVSVHNKNNPTSPNPTGSMFTSFTSNYDSGYIDTKKSLRELYPTSGATTFAIDAGCEVKVYFANSTPTTITTYTSTYKRNNQKIFMTSSNGNTTIQNNTYFKTLDGMDLVMEANKIYSFEMWLVGSDYVLVETTSRQISKTTSTTYNPPSLAAGQMDETTLTLTGAALGDFVIASFSHDLSGVKLFAEVSTTDTIRVTFFNASASPVDLASGTLKVKLLK